MLICMFPNLHEFLQSPSLGRVFIKSIQADSPKFLMPKDVSIFQNFQMLVRGVVVYAESAGDLRDVKLTYLHQNFQNFNPKFAAQGLFYIHGVYIYSSASPLAFSNTSLIYDVLSPMYLAPSEPASLLHCFLKLKISLSFFWMSSKKISKEQFTLMFFASKKCYLDVYVQFPFIVVVWS